MTALADILFYGAFLTLGLVALCALAMLHAAQKRVDLWRDRALRPPQRPTRIIPVVDPDVTQRLMVERHPLSGLSGRRGVR